MPDVEIADHTDERERCQVGFHHQPLHTIEVFLSLLWGKSKGSVKRFKGAERRGGTGRDESTTGLTVIDDLLVAKMDAPPMLWAGEGRIRGN